ncbi:MAG: hypothetical protein WD063_05215 [Pirellulales bacterium]
MLLPARVCVLAIYCLLYLSCLVAKAGNYIECVVLVRDGEKSYGIFQHRVISTDRDEPFFVWTDDLPALLASVTTCSEVTVSAEIERETKPADAKFQTLTIADALRLNRGQNVNLTVRVDDAVQPATGILAGYEPNFVQLLFEDKSGVRLEQYRTANIQSVSLDAKLAEQARLAVANLKKGPAMRHKLTVRSVDGKGFKTAIQYRLPVRPWALNYDLVKHGKNTWNISARSYIENNSGTEWQNAKVVLRQDSIDYTLPGTVSLPDGRRANVAAISPRPITVEQQAVVFLTATTGEVLSKRVLKVVNDQADADGRLALVKGPVRIHFRDKAAGPKDDKKAAENCCEPTYESELTTDLYNFLDAAGMQVSKANAAMLEYGQIAELAAKAKVTVKPYKVLQISSSEVTYTERRTIELTVENRGSELTEVFLKVPTEPDWSDKTIPPILELPCKLPGKGLIAKQSIFQHGKAKKKLDLFEVSQESLNELAKNNASSKIRAISEQRDQVEKLLAAIKKKQADIEVLRRRQDYAAEAGIARSPRFRRYVDETDEHNRQLQYLREDLAAKQDELASAITNTNEPPPLWEARGRIEWTLKIGNYQVRFSLCGGLRVHVLGSETKDEAQ